LLLAVKRDNPVGEKDKKLQPSGGLKVVMGWMTEELARLCISMIDTRPGSFVTACPETP
jgi:hypothetical protein